MTTQYTPGPWTISTGNVISGIRPDNSKLPLCVTTAYHIVHYGDQRDRNMSNANARLIAAAPDLLEALERIGEGMVMPQDGRTFTHAETVHEYQRIARKAVARAKGEACPLTSNTLRGGARG